MKYFTIYKVTNLTNGKYYIGKHITNNPDDSYMGSGRAIQNAIKKYGKENFKKEILRICADEKEMNLIEETLVDYKDEMSYNMTIGGKGGWCYVNENNLTNQPNHLEKKSKKMKEYWTESKRYEKSEQMKQFYQKNGTDTISQNSKKLHGDPAFKSRFVDKMNEVNKREEKRKNASNKIKEKWKDPNFIEKMKKRPQGSNSVALKEKWKDPVWRQMMLDKRKKNETNKNNKGR